MTVLIDPFFEVEGACDHIIKYTLTGLKIKIGGKIRDSSGKVKRNKIQDTRVVDGKMRVPGVKIVEPVAKRKDYDLKHPSASIRGRE